MQTAGAGAADSVPLASASRTIEENEYNSGKLSTDDKVICDLLYIYVYIKYLLHIFVVLPVLIKKN